MVNISHKTTSERRAQAQGVIYYMNTLTLEWIQQGQIHKENVLEVARGAELMGTKKSADLIPLCHSIMLTHAHVTVEYHLIPPHILCQGTAHTRSSRSENGRALRCSNRTLNHLRHV